jgi:D-beta-D-heptose 7-phosphate kinase/D-beta-D-heptose 1-phosphate adenosyltransferase
VITLGSQGLYLWTDNCGTLIKAVPNHVIDVTGAGDVVLAALAHYTDQGLDLLSAAKRANALAAIAVSKLGAYVITAQDLITVEDRVVFTNGCFDILHRGHVDYLKQSKAHGTKLVVGLNSDRSVRLLKGSSRPINSQQDRKAMLESLECVDEVIIFDEPTPRELILKVKPDIITKGGDYTVDQVVGNDLVNQVIIIPLAAGYSTTNLLEKINA